MRSQLKKNSSRKRTFILSFLILLMCLSTCYAYLSQSVKLNTIAKISKNTWDIHFENIILNENNADDTVPIISQDNTKIEATIHFKTPGDSYEFLVDVVNAGTIDAKVENIFKTLLTDEQLKYLEYSFTYMDGIEIKRNDSLKAGERDQIKLKIHFKEMSNPSYIPTVDETLKIEGEVLYVQDIGDGLLRERDLYYLLESNAKSDEAINFSHTASDTNGKGVYQLTKIATNSPIYYYRGEVENNNLIFAHFCWKMIRTTESGGIKLIYNGLPNEGVCNNTHHATEIASSSFNKDGINDPKYAGYMYDNNTKDSTIKQVVDEWFASNLLDYLPYLEDTPFYNERDYTMLSSTFMKFAPCIRLDEPVTVKLGAANKEDVFTVSSEIGNGALTYPVGLITSDETVLAGAQSWNSVNNEHENVKVFLNTYEWFWTMSPINCENNLLIESFLGAGNIGASAATSEFGVRPVLSLKPTTTFTSGDGTSNSPYIVTSN